MNTDWRISAVGLANDPRGLENSNHHIEEVVRQPVGPTVLAELSLAYSNTVVAASQHSFVFTQSPQTRNHAN